LSTDFQMSIALSSPPGDDSATCAISIPSASRRPASFSTFCACVRTASSLLLSSAVGLPVPLTAVETSDKSRASPGVRRIDLAHPLVVLVGLLEVLQLVKVQSANL
jgi:hypothetical protein